MSPIVLGQSLNKEPISVTCLVTLVVMLIFQPYPLILSNGTKMQVTSRSKASTRPLLPQRTVFLV